MTCCATGKGAASLRDALENEDPDRAGETAGALLVDFGNQFVHRYPPLRREGAQLVPKNWFQRYAGPMAANDDGPFLAAGLAGEVT